MATSNANLWTVRSLIEAGPLEGLLDSQGRALALFDDSLPEAETMRALGLSVRIDDKPEEFHSEEDNGNDDGEADPGRGTESDWTMTS